MVETSLKILVVVGSLNRASVTRGVLLEIAGKLKARGAAVDVLDFQHEPLVLFNPDTSHAEPNFPALQKRVEQADVFVLGTPDYHGGMSSTMKNFLDHFWREFAGKLFATVVASHEKGLTVTDQLRTVARQCYAWSMPYGVSFNETEDLKDGQIVSAPLKQRLEMFTRDLALYGALLAGQRKADLGGNEPGFLAKHRK